MAAVRLESVPVGFQDLYEGVADSKVENPKVVDVTGEGTQSVQMINDTTIGLIVRGDGAVGPNAFQIIVDAHIGEGDVPLLSEFEYDVISPDATIVSWSKKSREPIPKP